MLKSPNEGARLLWLAMETPRRRSQVEVDKMIAEALGRTGGRRRAWGGSVSRYLSGERLPERRIAVALRDLFEIPVEAWDQKPQSKRSSQHADGVSRGPAAVSTRKATEVSR